MSSARTIRKLGRLDISPDKLSVQRRVRFRRRKMSVWSAVSKWCFRLLFCQCRYSVLSRYFLSLARGDLRDLRERRDRRDPVDHRQPHNLRDPSGNLTRPMPYVLRRSYHCAVIDGMLPNDDASFYQE